MITDTEARKAQPKDKSYTIPDIDGLALFVHPNGGKSWHFRFSQHGKRWRISFGTYPTVTIREARALTAKAHRMLSEGKRPDAKLLLKGETTSAPTFKEVSERWQDLRRGRLKTNSRKGAVAQSDRYLEKDILPLIGNMPIDTVTRGDTLRVMRRIESRGALEVAKKVRTWMSQIFRHAIAEGHIEINPASDLDVVAVPQPKRRNNPSITFEEIPQFVKDIESRPRMSRLTQIGLHLLLLTAVRTHELRHVTLDQLDLENGVWYVPPEEVKQLYGKTQKQEVKPYSVPLSRQAQAYFEELIALTGHYKYLFAGRNDHNKMMSENTLNQAVKSIGWGDGKLTGHGIRGTFSTALNESGKFNPDWIEAQLSHADPDTTRAAYNHASYLEQRREMMQWWADQFY